MLQIFESMIKRGLIGFLALVLTIGLKAQVNPSDTVVAAFIPNFAYAFQWPAGDVAERYGVNSTIGGGLMYKSKKNVMLSLDVNFIFGNQIKNADDILRTVETSDGHIIDGNGVYTLYALYERGYSLNFRVGKIFNVLSPNPNSGLFLMAGAGYIVHRLNIDVQHNTAPQISGDYGKGYDRLTGGLNLNQFIGYFYMGKTRVLNFYAGFEIYEAFTKSQRDRVFDQVTYNEDKGVFEVNGKDNNNYFDLFYGIKIGWMIPIYKRAPDPYYYQ